jgi:hypothetical protein
MRIPSGALHNSRNDKYSPLDTGKMHIVQQLLTPGPEPTFGPRTVSLGAETLLHGVR